MLAKLRVAGLVAGLLIAQQAFAEEGAPAAAEPAKPAASSTEPTKSAAEPDKPAPPTAEPDKPAPEQAKPAAEAAKPAAEPAKTSGAAQTSICMLLESAARANDLPVEFFARVIWQESRFRSDAVGPVTRSGKRALGIAQFMPGTAAERNLLDPFDPIQALPKSAEFLRDLRKQFGNLGLAAAAYNAGPRRIREWLAGSGPMPDQTRHYVQAITGASVEQWAKGADDDKRVKGGLDCGQMVALLKRAPNPFVAALERRVVLGVMQPWGAILGADNSRDRMMSKYADLQHRHSAVLAGRDPILLERGRGPLPRFQVRIGAETRAAANELCSRIHKGGGDCVVLRNPKG